MKKLEWFAEIFPSLQAAKDEGHFGWVTMERAFDGPVGLVWQRVSPSGAYTGLPGCVEVSAEHAILMAAAPDMRDAIIEVLPFLPSTSASEGGAAKYSAHVAAVDKLRAALAKASLKP